MRSLLALKRSSVAASKFAARFDVIAPVVPRPVCFDLYSPSASATTYMASDLWEERVSSQLWAARWITAPAGGPSTPCP